MWPSWPFSEHGAQGSQASYMMADLLQGKCSQRPRQKSCIISAPLSWLHRARSDGMEGVLHKGLHTRKHGYWGVSSLESSYHSQIGSTKQGLREKRKTMWRSYPEQRQFSWPFRLRVLPSSLVGQNWKLQLKSINSICSCMYLGLSYWIQFSFHIMSSVTVNKSFHKVPS